MARSFVSFRGGCGTIAQFLTITGSSCLADDSLLIKLILGAKKLERFLAATGIYEQEIVESKGSCVKKSLCISSVVNDGT